MIAPTLICMYVSPIQRRLSVRTRLLDGLLYLGLCRGPLNVYMSHVDGHLPRRCSDLAREGCRDARTVFIVLVC